MVNPCILRRTYNGMVCMTPNPSAHLSIQMSSLLPVIRRMMCVTSSGIYQAVVGSLYLSTKMRPDIAYAVSCVSCVARFCAKPTKEHWTAIKRILRYLKGTHNLGLVYKEDTPAVSTRYSDADWAGDVGDRKSTSGYVFLVGCTAISWRSSKQTCMRGPLDSRSRVCCTVSCCPRSHVASTTHK